MDGFLENAIREFRRMKALGDGALAQAPDTELTRALDSESNSLAVLVRHLSGNMLSRWTDFLETDGEKPWRNRDGEFAERTGAERAELIAAWEEGWRCLFRALDGLGDDDLGRAVRIRGEELTVLQAILRQVSHYGYHVGQMVFLARHLVGPAWTSLSIPRGASGTFHAAPTGYLQDPPAAGTLPDQTR